MAKILNRRSGGHSPSPFSSIKKSTFHYKERRREVRDAWLFISPTVLLFIIFTALPVLGAICLSLTKFIMLTPIKFIGLHNYVDLFHDKRLVVIYLNTFKLLILLLPTEIILGLALAVIVKSLKSTWFKYLFRTVYFFPVMVTTSSVAIAWAYLLNQNFGVINYYLGKLSISPIPWLTSTFWSIPAIVLFGVWKGLGQPFIFFFIGLNNIPQQYYEASMIDGASKWGSFWHITLPLLSPVILFVLTLGFINGLQIFDEPYLITQGGPGDSSRTINLYIYDNAFKFLNLGYASTLSMTLFILILGLTAFQFLLAKKWVHYQ